MLSVDDLSAQRYRWLLPERCLRSERQCEKKPDRHLRGGPRVTVDTPPSRPLTRTARGTRDSSVVGACKSSDVEAWTAATKYSPGGKPVTSNDPFGLDEMCLM